MAADGEFMARRQLDGEKNNPLKQPQMVDKGAVVGRGGEVNEASEAI